MPTYEYECGSCGHTFEKFQAITASSLRKCPSCGRQKLQRLIGCGAAIIFKGSGFYETDYRSPEYQKAAKKEKESINGGKSSDKSEKPASGSDSSGDSTSKGKSDTADKTKKKVS